MFGIDKGIIEFLVGVKFELCYGARNNWHNGTLFNWHSRDLFLVSNWHEVSQIRVSFGTHPIGWYAPIKRCGFDLVYCNEDVNHNNP